MITKQRVVEIRSQLNEELKSLSKKLGIELSAGNAKFSESNITFKLECSVPNKDGNVIPKIEEDFNFYSKLHNLTLGSTFTIARETYKVVGYKPKSHKYPVICESLIDGKRYKFDEETIKKYQN